MIHLLRSPTSIADALANRGQWPVTYGATYTADDSAAAIFVMQASPLPGVLADSFSCVASAIQMTDLPESAPASGSPFYRVASITKLFPDAVRAAAFTEKINEAVQDLVNNLHVSEQLSETQSTVFAPTAPVTTSPHALAYDEEELAVNGNILTLSTF